MSTVATTFPASVNASPLGPAPCPVSRCQPAHVTVQATLSPPSSPKPPLQHSPAVGASAVRLGDGHALAVPAPCRRPAVLQHATSQSGPSAGPDLDVHAEALRAPSASRLELSPSGSSLMAPGTLLALLSRCVTRAVNQLKLLLEAGALGCLPPPPGSRTAGQRNQAPALGTAAPPGPRGLRAVSVPSEPPRTEPSVSHWDPDTGRQDSQVLK